MRDATKRHTKTLSWNSGDEAALRALRARLAAVRGEVWSERDIVAAALRAALDNPSALDPSRPAA
jgi:hypothetical protein